MFPKKDDPFNLLIESMVCGTDRAIRYSEKRGQSQFVQSEVLPRKLMYCTKKQVERMGIVFGEFAGDLFVFVTLPQGWKKEATDHAMWSKLVDEKGRERASIFYKAAFYDRDAHMFLTHRYTYGVEPVGGWTDDYREREWHCVIKDCGNIIWNSETVEKEPNYNSDKNKWLAWDKRKDSLRQKGLDWLNKNYPDWEDPLAYWEEDHVSTKQHVKTNRGLSSFLQKIVAMFLSGKAVK